MYNEQKANGVLTRENQNANNKSAEKAKKYNRSEILTPSHWDEGIDRGCEEEREGSPYTHISTPEVQNFEIGD